MSRFWIERAYGGMMLDTANPDRMLHLEQRLSNEHNLAPLAVQARKEMEEPSRS